MVRVLAGMLLLSVMAPGQGLAPEVLLLARIRRHMEQVLQRQPNYTCLETIERSRRARRNGRFRLIDALHLEVAVVDGKELFSWPGEREFKDRDLRELAPTGTIGNGSFALHTRSVFLSAATLITWRGEEVRDGRTVVRYDFQVPQFRSGYRIRIGHLEGIAGFRGSFWNDAETLDLVQLDVEAIDIPPHLPLRAAVESMRYARVSIGESTFLLPQSSEMTLEDFDGTLNRNAIRFSGCRQYSGESTLSFDAPPETGAGAPPAAPEGIALPAGLPVELELATRVQFPGNAIGDEVEARVRRDVRRKGVLYIPKGAVVKGNIALLERRRDLRGLDRTIVALQWREISFDGKAGPFEGQLEEGGAISFSDFGSRGTYLRPTQREQASLPHRDAFYVRKDTLDLPRGLPLMWRTLPLTGPGTKKP